MLTVALATCNRAESLRRTLHALMGILPPQDDWQLFVADNGSSDHTQQVLGFFHDRLPLRCFQHATAGKNAALNSLIPHFRGDLVVFTDDDVVPQADWLLQHRVLASRYPEYTAFGGRITPIWGNEPPPEWLRKAIPFTAVFAETDPAWPEGPCPPHRVWGANMSVRTLVFASGFAFDADYGPQEGNRRYRTGGETEFTRRLHAAGFRTFFSPLPAVGHIIRPEQLNPSALMDRAFRCGRLRAAKELNRGPIPVAARMRSFASWLWLEAQCGVDSLTRQSFGDRREMKAQWLRNQERGRQHQRAIWTAAKPAPLDRPRKFSNRLA